LKGKRLKQYCVDNQQIAPVRLHILLFTLNFWLEKAAISLTIRIIWENRWCSLGFLYKTQAADSFSKKMLFNFPHPKFCIHPPKPSFHRKPQNTSQTCCVSILNFSKTDIFAIKKIGT
jgi:hypothetical protein